MKSESDPLIGQLFAAKYEINALLGEGGMSRVYRARHKFMKRSVAVKLMHEDTIDDDLARARFQREAEAASKLSHPNVVNVHDFGITQDGRAFFIMDCLEGPTLDKILAERKVLPLKESLGIFLQALDGLAHAHSCGVIHRDVKPSNIVIVRREDGTELVKLVDFGIAKIVAPAEEKKQLRITQTGQIFGTACYMSPEQCQGATLDERSDLYSFGCLMYETLAGDPPFVGASFIATVTKHVSEKAESLSSKAPEPLPPAIDAVVMKCLEKKPENRFKNAIELKEALLAAAGPELVKQLSLPQIQTTFGNYNLNTQGKSKGSRRFSLRKTNLIALILLFLSLNFFGLWIFFCYRGTLDDYGSLYDKFRWQCGMADADTYIRTQKIDAALENLQECEKIAENFGDDNQRLELTLKKMLDAYSADRNEPMVLKVNAQLVKISHERTDTECARLMEQLKQLQLKSSHLRTQALDVQAINLAEHLSRCVDKLLLYAPQKEETLLKRAITVYDSLNLPQGTYRMRFRIQLAELYLDEDRLEDRFHILQEAKLHAPSNPSSDEAWWLKTKLCQMLAVIYSSKNELDKAKSEIDSAVSLSREHLVDKNLLRDCLNSSAQIYRKFDKAEYNALAEQAHNEAKDIARGLEQETEK